MIDEINQRYHPTSLLLKAVFIVALIGCTYQLYSVTGQYFRFDVVKEITYNVSDTIVLPSVTFCFELYRFINFSKVMKLGLMDKFMEIPTFGSMGFNEKVANQLIKLFGNLKLSQVFQLLDWERLNNIRVAIILDNVNYKVMFSMADNILDDRFKETIIFKNYKVCKTFSYGNGNEKHVWDRKRVFNTMTKALISFSIPKHLMKTTKGVEIMMHSPNTLPYGESYSILYYKHDHRNDDNDLSVTIFLRFNLVRNILMKYPYSSNCRDYSRPIGEEKPKQNQMHAIVDCENEILKSMFQCFSTLAVVDPTMITAEEANKYYSTIRQQHLQTENSNDNEAILKIMNQCEQKYSQKDCEQDMYSIMHYNTYQIQSNYVYFTFHVASEPGITTECRDKLTTLQWIIYIGSIFSFWFGIYITRIHKMLLHAFTGFAFDCKPRFKRSRNQRIWNVRPIYR